MRFNETSIVLIPVMVIALTAPALPAAPAGTAALDQEWILRAGGELGQDQSRASTVSLDYRELPGGASSPDLVPAWSGGLSGVHSDAPVQSGGTVTTGGEAYARYGTDALSGGLAFDSTRDDGFRRSPRWTATVDAGIHGFTGELSISTRRTTFDSFPASVPDATGRYAGSGLVDTNASCNLRDTGYGLNVGYSAAGWAGYAAGAGSHYDSTRCGYGLAGAGVVSHLNRGGFQQLAGAIADQGAARAGGELGQSTRLLQSSLGVGLSRQWGRAAIALDYTRTKDEVGGGMQGGYALTGSAKLTSRIAAQLSIGTTVADSRATPYVGVYLSVGW